MSFITVLGRAFASNLRTISPTSGEQTRLTEIGIVEPTIQRYHVWRRSVALMVVVTTILSGLLATYCEYTETGDRLSGLNSRLEKLSKQATELLPVPGVLDQQLNEQEEEEEEESGKDKPAEKPSAANADKANPGTNDDEEDEDPETAFSQFADLVHLLTLYALPIAALVVLFRWTRLKLSYYVLLAAFAFAFVTPMLIALCPWSWWGYESAKVSMEKDPAQYFTLMAERGLEGAVYLITLLPTVLSLIPGVQRACVRIKTLLPESMLSGWFLVTAAPFYALFLLVLFVAVNQIADDPVFLIGMFLLMIAPFLYVVKARVFVRPLMTDDDFLQMRRTQLLIGGITALAGILMLVYLATQQVMGVRVIGLDAKTSVFRPIDLAGFVLELLGRSMFMTLLGADLFLRMNLLDWKYGQQREASPEAADFHRMMGEFDRTAK